jgi:hypothetical protein
MGVMSSGPPPRLRASTLKRYAPVTATRAPFYENEAALAARWATGIARPVRLEDGRALRVVFPGVPGGSSGPDFTGAILDAGGDLLRGDVEVHLRASGWREHGHLTDPAYGGVVLHVVGENDTGALTTLHASGRAIAVLVLRAARGQAAFPPPFTPPCALESRRLPAADILRRIGERRLRMKAARIAPLVEDAGPGQALYTLLLETLGGAANRAAFASLARTLPLAPLIEAAGERAEVDRPLALAALLKGEAARLALRRAGLRPMAQPGARLEAFARLAARLWPAGADASWPETLHGQDKTLVRALRVPGIGRESAIELAVNAVLPVAFASGQWPDEEASAILRSLPSPGTYGKLRRLEGWLASPFDSAATLQGGLLMHADYCTKGLCGRCPLSSGATD